MRMTRTQINQKYPNRWVGIRDIQYEEGSRRMISADVIYTDKTASELAKMALEGEDIRPLFTTPDNCFQLGFQIGAAGQ